MKNRYTALLFLLVFLSCLSCRRNDTNSKTINHISDNERVTFRLLDYNHPNDVIENQTFKVLYTRQSFVDEMYYIDHAFVEIESEPMPIKLDTSNYNEEFFDNYCLMLTKVQLGMGYTYQHYPTEYIIDSDTLELNIFSSGNYSWFSFEDIYFLVTFKKDVLSDDILKMRIKENGNEKKEIWYRKP